MRETIDESQKIFQNGKQLLESCICKLNEKQRGKTGGNVALYPTVIVMMGDQSRCNIKYVKTTLDDNWNNARFLQYLNVVKTDCGWQCCRLCENDQKQSGEKQDDYAWTAEGADWEEELNRAIVAMLETEDKIFSRRTMIKMEYILDATEKDSMHYFDLFQHTANALQSDERKTLYLMLDQRPGADRVEASDALLQYIVAQSDTKGLAGTIYLLSNYLQSGQMLGDRKVWQNYRLAADLMLLGGSRKEAEGAVQKLVGGFKTVSYALATKPTEEIAAASLQLLMNEMYDTEQKNLFRELSTSEIEGKLQIDRYHGFAFLEQLFEKKICTKFPKETDWQYLPFASVQEYRRFLKDRNMQMETANALTCGAAAAFLDGRYLEQVRGFLADEKQMQQCREQISRLLSVQFAFFELLYLQEHQQEINEIILADYRFAGFRPGVSSCRKLHEQSIYESKSLFYKKMKQVIAEEMEQMIQRAQYLRELYAACTKEVLQERMVTGDESKSVEKFYGGVVSDYVGSCQKVNEHVTAFPEVFCVTNGKEELLGAIWNVFLELAKEKVYDSDFEQEVDYRMDGMDEKQRHEFVTKELRKKLEGSRRLKNSIEIPMTEAGCYYMVNASADYAKTLERADSREYALFDLSRTDCIEQLKIHDIIKPQQLHLGSVRDFTVTVHTLGAHSNILSTVTKDGNYDYRTYTPGLSDSGIDV